jgi:hypothetical protein
VFYFAAAQLQRDGEATGLARTPRGFLCGDSDGFTSAMTRLSPAAIHAAHDRYDSDGGGSDR